MLIANVRQCDDLVWNWKVHVSFFEWILLIQCEEIRRLGTIRIDDFTQWQYKSLLDFQCSSG